MTESTTNSDDPHSGPRLQRQLGLLGAVMVGLGSILGTGVFVSLGLATMEAGTAVVLAVLLAALVATANGLNSAQLAANHAVSGGTYEYGYHYLNPWLGFTAGWMFLCAKSASAATAALGFCGYLFHVLQLDSTAWHVPAALATLLVVTALTLAGLRRSNRVNIAIVSFTILALLAFAVSGLLLHLSGEPGQAAPADSAFWSAITNVGGGAGQTSWSALLYATALVFVAYTGYGRIATLGEEVHKPRAVIPRAMIITLAVTAMIYVLVAIVLVMTIDPVTLQEDVTSRAAPLEIAAAKLNVPVVAWLVAAGAASGMLSVLLNLLLGLSRVVMAMARRHDMPSVLAKLDKQGQSPYLAVILVAVIIGGLILLGDVKATWSFSAFTVLIYYAITNLAALFIPSESRLYPRWIAVAGLIACLSLAFFVEMRYWIAGLVLIAIGLLWHAAASYLFGSQRQR